jgi:hypothetical protein
MNEKVLMLPQVKRLKENRRKTMKEADKLNEDLKKAFKNMEATRYLGIRVLDH